MKMNWMKLGGMLVILVSLWMIYWGAFHYYVIVTFWSGYGWFGTVVIEWAQNYLYSVVLGIALLVGGVYLIKGKDRRIQM